MNVPRNVKSLLLSLCLGLILSAQAMAELDGELPEAGLSTNGTSAVTDSPSTSAVPPMVVEPPKEKKPSIRGAELRAAFRDVKTSRFGMTGKSRVLKMPDKQPREKKDDSWRRTIEFGINTARGNSDSLRYDGSVSARKEAGKNFYWLKAGGRYGESDDQKDAESAFGEAKYEHSLTERVYAGIDGHVFHDQIAALSYRARANLALGRHFIWTERTILSAELGPGYVQEKKGGVTEGFVAGRIAQYLEQLVGPNVAVWESLEYIPNLEDSAVFFLNAEVGLETILKPNLSLRFVVQNRYDSSPAEDKKRSDLLTTTSLNWNF
ncbi:MAG: hypothetical protein BWY59_01063 [Verrucomicrobia bacterium ADurb.Bin345]|nr:MAG: hypothetical protein BWY59_01063 [Verrucomicrobia bacterium ADurb.Bin345]